MLFDECGFIAPKLWSRGKYQCIRAHGRAGGVVTLWDPWKVTPLWWTSSRHSLTMVASSFLSREVIPLIDAYAPTDLPKKSNMWTHIHQVRYFSHLFPWILVGDFDAISCLEEKWGGVARLHLSSTLLRDNICCLNLVYINPGNGMFTWSNRRCGVESILERLDKFLVYSFWIGNWWVSSSDILD